ncbi:MAG: MarR family winged helix-turn-helix transcriptional regulator [Thermoleophilaceae bacterium]
MSSSPPITHVAETRPGTPAAFAEAWESFFVAVRRARGRASRGQSGLTLSQLNLLRALEEHGERPVGLVAEAAEVAGATATRMLDGLEREGLVTRRSSAEDRRVVMVALTDRGQVAVAQKRARVDAKLLLVFERLTPDEQRRAEPLLRRLAEVVDEL